jgi:hypothetical protein
LPQPQYPPAQIPPPQQEAYPWPDQDGFRGFGDDWRLYRDLYRELALLYAGVDLPRDFVLVPFKYNRQTEVVTRDDGTIVSLDAATPTRTMRFEFPVFAFAQRLTARVIGMRLTEDGQPEAGFFANGDPLDFVEAEISYAQRSEQLTSGPMPLSELAGQNASLGGVYLFSALPWIPKGTTLDFRVSINVPTFGGATPPFVRSVALISVTWDTLRIPILGG